MNRLIHKCCALALAFGLAGAVATAQESEPDTEKGLSLMEEGAKLFMRGMIREMEPALEDLRLFGEKIEPELQDFMAEMGPALASLLSKIDDITAYEAPEMLPNGDIIMRRKVPLAPEGTPDSTPLAPKPEGGEIDL